LDSFLWDNSNYSPTYSADQVSISKQKLEMPDYNLYKYLRSSHTKSTHQMGEQLTLFSNGTASNNNSTTNGTDTNGGGGSNSVYSFLYDRNYDYIVTFDWAVTILDDDLIQKHQFRVINITLDGYNCFGPPLAEALLPIGGLDRAVLNNVIYSIKKSGFMYTHDGDLYHWSMQDVYPYQNALDWISYKLGILIYSLLAFVLISTTTALLVRVLISSGVVIIFPIFWCMQLCGMQGINLRILAYSYPWIGVPLQMIQARNAAAAAAATANGTNPNNNAQSVYPFIIAHFVRVVLYYLLYITAQNVFLKWLYPGITFIQGQLWLYAIMMIWEYYSMIYVRAVGSIQLFPRTSLAAFLIFHFYYYSYPSGFHILALMVMFFFITYVMIFCVRVFEVKAFRQGLVSIEQPR
jgi:hypothetical protein